MAFLFDTDTTLVPAADGAFDIDVSTNWNAMFDAPNGGHSAAITVKAIGMRLEHPDPLVVSTTFLRRPVTGPSVVTTEVVRTGRRLATGQASLWGQGKESVRTIATFGDLAQMQGRTVARHERPDLPSPEDCRELDTASAGVSIAQRFRFRAPRRTPEQKGLAEAMFWMRFSDDREPDLLSLVQIVDGAIPPVALLGEPTSTTIELTTHLRAHPAPGWLACRTQTRTLVEGLHEEDFDVWDSTGTLVAQARQLAMLV